MNRTNSFPAPDPSAEERALIECAKRDPEAFAALYDRYLAPVYRYLYTRAGFHRDAEDLTSQVFLAALENLPRFRHQGSFRAWLFGIARRKAADFYRQYGHQVSLESAADVVAPGLSPLAEVAHTEQLQLLARRIVTLPLEDQELLRLRFAAGLSFAELAELLNKKESAVKMALYRLLERLQSQMEVERDA